MNIPIFIDFEASSLRDVSYPIEVAWNNSQGEITSYLIRPQWDWSDWDYNAQVNIHKIERETIVKDGLPAAWVAVEMNKALAGTIAYSDNPAYDGFWLERLFEDISEDPSFEIRNIGEAMPDTSPQDLAWLAKQARQNMRVPPHRAANDVAYLLEIHRLALRR